MGMAKSSTTAIATSKCITIMVSIFTQRIDNSSARISILLVDPTSIRYSNSLMLEAVSRVVGTSMYNEMIDSSLQRPYLRLVFVGDINLLRWKPCDEYEDCESVEIKLCNGEDFVGKAVFMRGGFHHKNPNAHMNDIVDKYIKKLDNAKDSIKYETYNELIEAPLDNLWFRVILLNINKLVFEPFM